MQVSSIEKTCLALLLLAWGLVDAGSLTAQERTVALDLRGRRIEGMPLAWDAQQIDLLGRDGQLYQFPPREAANLQQPVAGFRPYGVPEMRGLLFREFGSPYEVSGTGHFLVVHPKGERDRWAERFEGVYRAFHHYFVARGFPLRAPQFPLVAVVFPSREHFARYAKGAGLHPSAELLGFYSPQSNRILLFDQGAGGASPQAAQQNLDTIIHEVTHQVAFNCGVHGRFAQTPRWVVEGLGTMFEARGVWNAAHYPTLADRINRGRLADFRQYVAARRRTGQLAEFLQSNRSFDLRPLDAYAEAWALTFYLSETQPRQYAQYLQKLAALRPFTSYEGPQRTKDFTDVFGHNLQLIESRYLAWLSQLK